MIQAILASSLAIFGIICGMIIGWMAKEELVDGKKYFLILQNLIAGLIGFFIFESIYISLVLVIVLSVSSHYLKDKNYSYVLFFVLLLTQSGSFPIIAGLIFLYGFPAGSIIFLKKFTTSLS